LRETKSLSRFCARSSKPPQPPPSPFASVSLVFSDEPLAPRRERPALRVQIEASAMNDRLNPTLARRDLLRVLAVAGAATGATTAPLVPAAADSESNSEKRKARYQPNSAEVQTFYRVNRYPAT
jgi:hypothetical protein